jgi:glutathione S-transferase
MITLYTMPGSCSLAPHITLQELGLPHQVKILKRGGTTELWQELKDKNGMGSVPVIITDEGYTLTEGAAIQQYLLSKKPGNTMFAESGEARFRGFEWMNFIASGLHKSFTPLFGAGLFSADESAHAGIHQAARKNLHHVLQVTDSRFSSGEFAMGSQFTIVDTYLFVVLSWCKRVEVDLAQFPKLSSFVERTSKRPAVVAAMKAEGLI